MEIESVFTDLSGDGGVLKHVITPGDAEKGNPPIASTVKGKFLLSFIILSYLSALYWKISRWNCFR